MLRIRIGYTRILSDTKWRFNLSAQQQSSRGLGFDGNNEAVAWRFTPRGPYAARWHKEGMMPRRNGLTTELRAQIHHDCRPSSRRPLFGEEAREGTLLLARYEG